MAEPLSTNTTDRPKIPKIGAEPKDLREWVDQGIYYRHRLRAIDWSNWRRSELYDGGYQHLRAASASYDGVGSYSQWTRRIADPNSSDYIPLPVINEGQGVRANESARLGRPNYHPKVIPKLDSYEARMGAENAEDLLRDRLRTMEWPYQNQVFYYHIPMYGGAWLNSEWVLEYDQITMVPKEGAVACPRHDPRDPSSCPSVLSDPIVNQEQAGQLAAGNGMGVFEPVPPKPGAFPGPPQAKTVACPTCPDHPPLGPFQASMEEAREGQDMLGRPLGTPQPIGDWWLTVESPYDMFPRNLGLDMRPGAISEWTKVKVQNLDWVAKRYPTKIKDVKPESPAMLAQVHPVAGTPDFYGGMETSLFRDCVRVKERHKEPWMELQEDGQTVKQNQGRSVVLAGDTVLMDGPLMIESLTKPGDLIPRVLVDYVPWEFRDGGRRLTGLGIWDLIYDAQDGLNECVSQQQAIRQRMAVPFYVASRAMNFEISALSDGVPGRLAEIDPDPINPSMIPSIINNQTAPPGIAEEATFYKQEVSALPGEVEVDKGQVPPNVSAAIAIQSLKTYASEKREGRLLRIQTSLRRVWHHGLQLMAALYLEPRPVRAEDDDNVERWRNLSGLDLKGQTEVEIESEPDFDEKQKDQELLNQFIGNGLIDPTQLQPAMRRKIIKIYDGPEDLTKVDDLQVNRAQKEWISFRDQGIIPVIDPALDDPVIHGEEHGENMNTEFFRSLCEKAHWQQQVLPLLAPTWDMSVQQALSMPPQPMMPDPSGQTTTTQDPMTGALVAQPVMIPSGPPIDLQGRIVQTWTQTLAQNGILGQQPGTASPTTNTLDQKSLSLVLEYYAHKVAHEKEAEMRQAQVQMGQQVAAAPGSANTQGMVPTQQAAASQGQQATAGMGA